MACTYILWSESRHKRYVGSSREDTPDSRLTAHNQGHSRWTKSGIPWILVRVEYFADYSKARRRELFLKSGQGRKWLDEHLHIEREKTWKGAGVV